MNQILLLGDVVPYQGFNFSNKYKLVFNLESPITIDGIPEQNKVILSVKDKYLESIFSNKILAVSLANNHIFDFGEKGFGSTIDYLQQIGVPFFGAGLNERESCQPLLSEIGGIKVAFIGYTCVTTHPILSSPDKFGTSLLAIERILSQVSKIRKSVDRIIVYLHWGMEEVSYPRHEDILIARKLIEHGVDIIIGTHSHCIQPIEKYKKGIIAYGLGNFIMPKLNNIPSFFDEKGIAHKKYFKRLMIWNRISLGVLVELKTMNFKAIKYLQISNKIVKLNIPIYNKIINQKIDVEKKVLEELILRRKKRRSHINRIVRLYKEAINIFYNE